ncbi:hypothetical protein GobsT_51650 [Gemmata obscuriglobus]|uniref:Uncharacterized protein n=1 Tax=Gemmata obscuriglobus TaxID=114 RepID=A0A2Z3H1F0_9BACT|nr:hypothetical protein [Gemmata obscuriglobus]AWM36955.1 hypothetical protein C1280_07935 [Gemmata obscuriglobus]QEG30360.1 hypothetical protein GobsT_51650 [Gemmata obscuriglobus]VTS09684.1 Uncharacterized protein OS=Isosphaera pallida (strain ATCC 43644 / DSM 9630 / IS1B) GN=Isop_2456 PE=4 SV=1 [Gemmata obscuriglobus UQM 2246]
MSTATTAPLTVAGTIHFARKGRTKELREGPAPAPPEPGRVPRVARLMALALRFDELIRTGSVTDQAELARLGHVTRARVSQIMALIHLAPDLIETVLFLPPVVRGRDPLVLRDLRPIAATSDWARQRAMWRARLDRVSG